MYPGNYRYYRLDGGGQIHGAERFGAESDDGAVAVIEAKHPDCTCEIWLEKRLVATVSPKNPSA